jgi:pantetheine-phosphate adenylyltransferase
MKSALFPGSFDPFTKGHFDVVNRALPLFDEIIIGIGYNTTKQYLLPLAQRIEQIEILFKGNTKIKVLAYEGLTTSFAAKMNCSFLVRGIRNSLDYEYEKSIAEMNKKLEPNIETIFLNCSPEFASISSTIVREILKSGGDITQFLP